MNVTINDYVLDNVFTELPKEHPDDLACWYTTTKDNDGWIMLWEDGETFHTYHYPPDWYGHG